MKPRVYLETTIVSYLTARPSRDLVRAAHQEMTCEWWAGRDAFDLYVSEIVVKESAAGDPGAAAARLATLRDVPLVPLTPGATELARQLLQ